MNILVFPSGMPESLEFARNELSGENSIIGASSIQFNGSHLYPIHESLPFVTQANFDALLAELIVKHAIDAIYTPHPVVWQKIYELLNMGCIDITLLNEHPAEMALDSYRQASAMAAAGVWSIDGICDGWVVPEQWFRVGLFHALRALPGQSSYEKLSFLSAVVMNLPRGDIVEIGSLWGRSAYALSLAAHQNQAGPVICVDPWSEDAYKQPGSNLMVDRASSAFDAQKAFDCFLSNLAPFAGTGCNYLRMPSNSAVEVYKQKTEIRSDCFGSTEVNGCIALLHIDGNHDLEAVQQDLEMWTPYLCEGSWLVIDDYCWAFGDGPRLASDAWFKIHCQNFRMAFVAFGCFFAQINSRG
jgi:hypothetical protein